MVGRTAIGHWCLLVKSCPISNCLATDAVPHAEQA